MTLIQTFTRQLHNIHEGIEESLHSPVSVSPNRAHFLLTAAALCRHIYPEDERFFSHPFPDTAGAVISNAQRILRTVAAHECAE